MTEEEAINFFQNFIQTMTLNGEKEVLNNKYCNASRVAISALEKQIAKKPLIRFENMGYGISPNETFKIYVCPCCKEDTDGVTSYCQNCGQKLDWSEGE